MTLLAAFPILGVPVLVGDMVISNSKSRQRVALSKKVHIVAPNCALSFVGSHIVASAVFKRLFEAFSSSTIRVSDLEKVLTSFPEGHFGNLEARVGGWIIEETSKCFRWTSSYPIEVFYLSSNFDGSAGRVLEAETNSEGIIDSSEPWSGDYQSVKWSALQLVSKLTASEIVGELDPELAFGHAFEVVYFDPEKGFQYIDNILYSILDISVSTTGDITDYHFAGGLVKYRAYGNYAVTASYDMAKNATSIQFIRPLGYRDREIEKRFRSDNDPSTYNFPMLSDWYCVDLRYKTAERTFLKVGFVIEPMTEPTTSDPIIGVDEKGSLQLRVSKEFLKSILDLWLRDQVGKPQSSPPHRP